jgi:hypothetical protein
MRPYIDHDPKYYSAKENLRKDAIGGGTRIGAVSTPSTPASPTPKA